MSLEGLVDSELAWCRRELTSLITTLRLTSLASVSRELTRASFCLLYAHWEGAIKKTAQLYAEDVRKRGLPYQDLSDCFRAMIFKEASSSALQSKRISPFIEAAKKFDESTTYLLYFDFESMVRTEGNLSSEVLREIHKGIGLTYPPFFAVREKFIDERLVKVRNHVAHGEGRPVDTRDFEEVHDKVIEMIDYFSQSVISASEGLAFMRV